MIAWKPNKSQGYLHEMLPQEPEPDLPGGTLMEPQFTTAFYQIVGGWGDHPFDAEVMLLGKSWESIGQFDNQEAAVSACEKHARGLVAEDRK